MVDLVKAFLDVSDAAEVVRSWETIESYHRSNNVSLALAAIAGRLTAQRIHGWPLTAC